MGLSRSSPPAVLTSGLERRFGDRRALQGVDLEVAPGEIFALLGPNGGGKTTLFRILATLLAPTAGRAEIFGEDAALRPDAVRRRIGVVFQSPAVDRLLTVSENLEVQGRLYGMRSAALRTSAAALLARLRLEDRARDRVGTLSGGLLRRVEIAKGLLHRPELFLLDEPTTGLDPVARQEVWDYLREARDTYGVTVVATTNLMEEAERCDRVAILSRGSLVACGAPRALKEEIGGDVLVIAAREAEALRPEIERITGLRAVVVDGTVRLESPDGAALVPRLSAALGARIESIALGRPTLYDVFARRTGHRYSEASSVDGARGSL
jgi:ABC-2 type transport system ATP-binding protein